MNLFISLLPSKYGRHNRFQLYPMVQFHTGYRLGIYTRHFNKNPKQVKLSTPNFIISRRFRRLRRFYIYKESQEVVTMQVRSRHYASQSRHCRNNF